MVELAGPPPVRFTDSSNSCNVPLVDIIAVSKIIGFKSGMVIFLSIWKYVAPSIFAASYMEYSIFEVLQDKIPCCSLSISKAVR